jgi:hypothetical protein
VAAAAPAPPPPAPAPAAEDKRLPTEILQERIAQLLANRR